MTKFRLTRYFPAFVDTNAKTDYGLHKKLRKAKRLAQKTWDEWTSQSQMQPERLKWNDEDPRQISGSVNTGMKDHPQMVVFLIQPQWEIEIPEIKYNFEKWVRSNG